MPLFTVVPIDQASSSTDMAAIDAGGILAVVERLNCQEADVMQDGVYAFSARLGGNGLWTIFQRDDGAETSLPARG